MYRSAFLLICAMGVLYLPQQLSAQGRPFTEFKIGTLDPRDAGAGTILGISSGRRIDDRLYWGIEANYFKTTFRQETTVAEFDSGGINFRDKQLEIDFSTRILALFFKIDYELKLDNKSPFYFRASGGIGGEFIWNNENNFLEDVERTRFFRGFGWQVSSGLGIKVSRTGIAFVDVFYNDARATRNRERNEQGLPTFQQIDVSGFGIKAGINILGLGF